MKGAIGLMIAAGLGIVGAVCNWFYLDRLAQDQDKVHFIAMRPDVTLNVGDVIQEDHLMDVPIPQSGVGNLERVAPQWAARFAVIGQRANRAFTGREIILDSDLTTPAHQDLSAKLQENEVLRWVPIDSRTVVAEQINPGDLVSFEVPRLSSEPTPGGTAAVAPAGTAEIIGPFRVLAIGTRRERPNVASAGRPRSGTENTIAIAVELAGGKMEARAQKLFEALRLAGNQAAQVLLHSDKVADDQ